MARTSNHNYEMPEKGSTDWHIPLNKNFETIDSNIEVRDSESNRDDYEPKNGAKFEATDSGAVYHGNGERWVLSNRQVDSLNAREFNSIQAPPPSEGTEGIERVISGPNTVVWLQPGVYEGALTIEYDNIILKGAGAQGGDNQPDHGATTIRANSNDSPVTFNGNYPDGGLVLDGICIDGNKHNYDSGPAINYGVNSAHHRVMNCKVVAADTHAIHGVGIFNCIFRHNQFHDNGSVGKTSAVFNIGGKSDNVSHIIIEGNDIRDYDGGADNIVDIRDGTGIRVLNNEAGMVAGNFLRAGEDQPVQTLIVEGNYAEVNNQKEGRGKNFAVIGTNNTVSDLTIKNSFSYQYTEWGIDLQNVDRAIISNNRMAQGDASGSFRVSSNARNVQVEQNDFSDGESIDAPIHRVTALMENPDGSREVRLSDNGARLYVDRNGDVVVESESGRTSQLT